MSLMPDMDGFVALTTRYADGTAPHALLLIGESGTGKRTLAHHLAMALLCQSNEGNKPCTVCRACQRIKNDAHSQVLSLVPSGSSKTVKVEQVRELVAKLASYGIEEGRRLVIVPLAENLTPQAQNALLKNLEEPDVTTWFILTCEQERRVLPTIRSRCQSLRVPLRDEKSILHYLGTQGHKGREAQRFARHAQGSPGRAMALATDAAYWQLEKQLSETLSAIQSPSDLPQASMKLRDMKDASEQVFHLLTYWLNDACLSQAKGEYTENDNCLGRLDLRGLSALLAACARAQEQSQSNVSWQAIIDQWLIQYSKEISRCLK